jgi:hypothetical protein
MLNIEYNYYKEITDTLLDLQLFTSEGNTRCTITETNFMGKVTPKITYP